MNHELRQTLIDMMQAETHLWQEMTEDGRRYGDATDIFVDLRIKNAEALEQIIKQYGWPGKSLVGKEGANAAFRIARTAIDKPALMQHFLKYIKPAVVAGEALPLHQACLQDCILFNQGQVQEYGLFFDWDESGELVVNVKDRSQANLKRKALGLETIEEALQKHKQELQQESGVQPQDFKQHRRQAEQWARRVGWISS